MRAMVSQTRTTLRLPHSRKDNHNTYVVPILGTHTADDHKAVQVQTGPERHTHTHCNEQAGVCVCVSVLFSS